MNTAENTENHEDLIRQLEASGFKVLRPFAPVDEYAPATDSPKKVVMFLDYEATGKDAHKDIPIEIGYVLAEYDPEAGTVHRVIGRHSGLEDPGVSLTEEIQKITGLKDEDVAGQRFNDEQINADIDRADLIVAHNAGYDRVIGERRFPALKDKAWACTLREGPWEEMGIGSRTQEFLAFKVAGIHYGAHRALADCEALLEIMTAPAHDGRPCFAHVLNNARRLTYTVWAEHSPFDMKDVLKNERNYRWSGGEEPGKLKAWHKEFLTDVDQELQFLADKIYGRQVKVTVDSLTANDRYSVRATERRSVTLPAPQGVESAVNGSEWRREPVEQEFKPMPRRGFGRR